MNMSMDVIKKVKQYYNEYYTEIELNPNKPNFEEFKKNLLVNRTAQNRIIYYFKQAGILKKKKILIIGCGPGRLERAILAAHDNKSEIYALDPYFTAVSLSEKLDKTNTIKYVQATGEKIPFRSNFFDAVISSQVMEHVKNIEAVAVEINRILKPGGVTYHICPNFRSFYEGHYKIFWLPVLSKKILSLYLKFRGYSDRALYEELLLLTPAYLKKIFIRNNFKNIDARLFKKYMLEKLNNSENINNKFIKKNFKILKVTGFIYLVKLFVNFWPFFNVFHIYAEKPDK